MNNDHERLDEKYVRLALAINEHQPGYVDSYFGPGEWEQQASQDGKIPLPELNSRVDQLANDLSRATDWDAQRKDFLERQISAMKMSLRLLADETVPFVEEARGLYDIQPTWKDEADFMEFQKWLDESLPKGGTLNERFENWQKSLEISVDKAKELLPFITDTLRELAHKKFDLPEEESFNVEFVHDQPWMAYNQYLGEYKSQIEINADLPMQIDSLMITIAHEGYPGHHTELAIKDAKLIRQKGWREHFVTLLNSPWGVIAEGIATTALETLLTDQELEDFYREELLPRAKMKQVNVRTMLEINRAEWRIRELWGNAAFLLHDQKKSADEIVSYLKKYALSSEEEARRTIEFISGPLDRTYIFTYTAGYKLLKELFSRADRNKYFARLLSEPVTPNQIRTWISTGSA
ncbi:MAG: hypothetical protein MHPDNHAH_02230 [Anaerolineales bacterium]|nr:hypothetical protein [Anaerolineales bacterium]WKZ47635.1 MAG: hypothetical protein QY306_17655 [Anaerolineales bacterium]